MHTSAYRISAQHDLLALRDVVNPPAIRRSRSLNWTAKEVYFALLAEAGYTYGLLNLSYEAIAAQIGCTADAVRAQVDVLAARKLVTQVVRRNDGTRDLAIDDTFGWIDPAERDRPLLRFDELSIEDAPPIPRVDLPAWLRDKINPPHVRKSNLGALEKQCFYALHLASGCAYGEVKTSYSALVADVYANRKNADRKGVHRAVASLVEKGYVARIAEVRRSLHLHVREPGLARVEAPAQSQDALFQCGFSPEESHITAGDSNSDCGFSADESHIAAPRCADEVSAKVAEIVGRELGQRDRLVTFDGSTRFAAEDGAFVVTASDEARCRLLRAKLLWPVLRPAVTAVIGESTPIRFKVDPALGVCGFPPEKSHKGPLKYLSLKSSELPASRGSSEGTEDLKRASVCGFSAVESHKPLAKRVDERALAIRVALGAPTFFHHWRPAQAALAVECGQLDAGDLDALVDHCAQKADKPFAMFARRIPIVFAQAGLVWLDEAEFKGVARNKLGACAWDHPWPVAYPRRAKRGHSRDPPRSA